jgi:aryl-alcohol dehydrogenase-like predicted oxidoreductase
MNPHVSAVITGASRPEQVIDNCAALKVMDKLTADIMAEIDQVVGSIQLDPTRQD